MQPGIGFPEVYAASLIAAKNRDGIHFRDANMFYAGKSSATVLAIFDGGGSGTDFTAVASFTELTRRGAAVNTTNWTNGDAKTLLSVSSGAGLIAAIIGPTSGSSVNTIFEITGDDGRVQTITVPTTSGTRAFLLPTLMGGDAEFTTASFDAKPSTEAMTVATGVFSEVLTNVRIQPWRKMANVPMFRYDQKVLVRVTHGADITNATATAYSAVLYRKRLTA